MEVAVRVSDEVDSISNWSGEKTVWKIMEDRICSQNSIRKTLKYISDHILWNWGTQIIIGISKRSIPISHCSELRHSLQGNEPRWH